MRSTYFKFRILLLTLAFGLASVPFFYGLYESWTEIKVDVPQVESDVPIYIVPLDPPIYSVSADYSQPITKEEIIQNRDLSLYDKGGEFSDCYYSLGEERKCNANKAKARNFIWEYWQSKKRAYIVITFSSCDWSNNAHIFIEPDENDKWHIVWIWEIANSSTANLDEIDIFSVTHKSIAKDNYEHQFGKYALSFLDKNGEQVANY